MRVSGNDGTSWLKAPDGWILENVVDSNGLFVRSNIIPLHEQNSPRSGEKTTIESIIDNQSESFKRKLFRQDSPHRPSRRELANKFLDKISSEQTKPPLQKQEEVNRKLSYDETETFTEKLVEKAQTMQRSFGDSSIKLEFEAIQKFSQRTEQSEDGTNTRKLVDLQTSLQEVAMNLADLSRSVVACQNSLSALVEGNDVNTIIYYLFIDVIDAEIAYFHDRYRRSS